jgi:hypothetical protein
MRVAVSEPAMLIPALMKKMTAMATRSSAARTMTSCSYSSTNKQTQYKKLTPHSNTFTCKRDSRMRFWWPYFKIQLQ